MKMKGYSFCAIFLLWGHLVLAEDCLLEVIRDPVDQFKSETSRIAAREISDVISLSLGMSTEPISYEGLLPGQLFHKPSASLTIVWEYMPGIVETCSMSQHDSVSFRSTRDSILDVFGEKSPVIIDYASSIKLTKVPRSLDNSLSSIPGTLDGMEQLLHQEDSVLNSNNMRTLNATETVDLNLFSELQLIKEVFDKVSQNYDSVIDGTPDLYSFVLSGLREIQEVYGPDSQKALDAFKLMEAFLDQIYQKVDNLYEKNVLITVVKVQKDAVVRRSIRAVGSTAAPGPTPTPPEDKYNVAPNYSSDFPILFNIIFWLVVILTLAIIAIAYMLGSMDPGDTIIYRMTSQRIKMD